MPPGFTPRHGADHKHHANVYKTLEGAEQDEYDDDHSAKWFELCRLSYFDPVRMAVLDPMHNILLGRFCSLLRHRVYSILTRNRLTGVVKTQWYDAWIRPGVLRQRTKNNPRELDDIHEYLKDFEMPTWVARLPQQVGYPACGSLTSDE